MAGTNNISVHVVADTTQYNAALTEAGARAEKFGAIVNKSTSAQAAVSGEQALSNSARSTAQAWVASRTAIIDSETRMTALLKAGRKADVGSLSSALTEMEQRRDAYIAATQAYYGTLSADRAASFAEQEAVANKEIESTYQTIAARADDVIAAQAESAALDENTVALTMNATAMRETGFAASELATGRYGRLETSLLSVANRTGLMRMAFSPLGLTIAGAAVAVGTFATALIEGERESGAFNRAILETGNAAGLTEGQFNSMAEAIAGGDITIGTARNALLALTQSGKFTGQTLEQAAQAAVDFADLTGQSMKQATAAVETLATKPVEAIQKLDAQLHFLTVAEFEHIQQLAQEGHATQAVQAAVEALATATHRRAVESVADEGTIVRSWEGIKRAVTGTWDIMKGIGRDDTLDQRISSLKSKLDLIRAGGDSTDAATNNALAAQVEAQIRVLEIQKQQQEQVAKQTAEQDRITAAGIRAAAYLNKQTEALKTVNVALEHERELTAQIEALHKASPADKLLQGDTFDKAGKLTHGNATYQALIAKIQKQFDAHPIKLHIAPPSASGVGAESTSGTERMIADDQRLLSESQRIDQMRLQTAQRVDEGRVASAKQALDEAVAAGQMSAAQREVIERQLTDALYKEDLKRLQQELSTLTQGTASYQQVADQIELIEQQHYQKLEALDAQYQQAQRKQQQQELADRKRIATQVEGIENQMLSGIISGRMNWASMERRLFQQVAGAEIEAALHAATERLIIGEEADTKRKAIESATAMKSIGADAAQAAAAAYRAMVGIPYVGPIVAPAAAAVAFAAVGAYKSLVSFDVGSYSVPHDMPAMVHRGEAILPRPFAEDFRSAIAGRGPGGGGGGGDTHLHVHATDGESVERLFANHGAALAAVLKRQMRNGVFG